MTIRTEPGPLALDAGDFQFTHNGTTVGLKLSYVDSPVGVIASIVAVEKVGAEWVLKEELVSDFSADIVQSRGVAKWLSEFLIPRLNAWLTKRFAGDKPTPVPAWVPQVIVDLDAAMLRLNVKQVGGVPQVEAA